MKVIYELATEVVVHIDLDEGVLKADYVPAEADPADYGEDTPTTDATVYDNWLGGQRYTYAPGTQTFTILADPTSVSLIPIYQEEGAATGDDVDNWISGTVGYVDSDSPGGIQEFGAVGFDGDQTSATFRVSLLPLSDPVEDSGDPVVFQDVVATKGSSGTGWDWGGDIVDEEKTFGTDVTTPPAKAPTTEKINLDHKNIKDGSVDLADVVTDDAQVVSGGSVEAAQDNLVEGSLNVKRRVVDETGSFFPNSDPTNPNKLFLDENALTDEDPVVTGVGGSPTYVEDTDYTVDKPNGVLTRLTGGSISDGASVEVDYEHSAEEGSDYTVAYATGVITLLSPRDNDWDGDTLRLDYKWGAAEDVDYTVDHLSGVIERIPGGQIPSAGTVQVSYTADPVLKFQTTTVGFWILRLLDGVHNASNGQTTFATTSAAAEFDLFGSPIDNNPFEAS